MQKQIINLKPFCCRRGFKLEGKELRPDGLADLRWSTLWLTGIFQQALFSGIAITFVITRARRDAQGSDDSSLDSDATLELHLSDGLGDLSDGPLSDDLRLQSPHLLTDRWIKTVETPPHSILSSQ